MQRPILKALLFGFVIVCILTSTSISNATNVSLSKLYPEEKMKEIPIPRKVRHLFPKASERVAWKERKDIPELRIAKDADGSDKYFKARIPLQLAKDKGHKEIVELLLKHGAKE